MKKAKLEHLNFLLLYIISKITRKFLDQVAHRMTTKGQSDVLLYIMGLILMMFKTPELSSDDRYLPWKIFVNIRDFLNLTGLDKKGLEFDLENQR